MDGAQPCTCAQVLRGFANRFPGLDSGASWRHNAAQPGRRSWEDVLPEYCVFCGSAKSQSWICDTCGATPANPWPATGHDVLDHEERLADDGSRDEVRPLTALFADIVGSTALGERLAPDEVKTLVGECVNKMTLAVESYGGVVRSFMGDGVAAFFGLEVAREDDPIRAALAALRILEDISEYAREIEGAWGIRGFAVRVGINSGWVAAGLVGGADPQFVALGDPVNVAARLQASTAPGSIIVGGSTAVRLAGRFELERLGQVTIRGRTQPVEAWGLLAYKGEPESLGGGPFVGRSSEIERFGRAIEELSLGRGQILIILGDPGLGKSRLMSEFHLRCPRDVLWLSGRCSYQHVRGPYGPFVDILRSWLDIKIGAPEVLARVRLTARLREVLGSAAVEVLPYLGQLLSVELDPAMEEEFRRRSPEDRANAVRLAYVRWISRLARDAPVALAIDDVDRADASTEALLRELFQLTDQAPVLLMLALRAEAEAPGWEARIAALAHHAHRTVELSLDPLSNDEGDELVALMDPEGRLSPAARRELCLRGEGNAFYLEELSRAAVNAVEASGQHNIDASDLELPPALEGLLLARIDRVSPRARGVLQVAAVCGRRFEKAVLQAAAGPREVEETLVHLVREGLLKEDGRYPSQCFAFRHGLYQEAVLRTLPPARLRELHESVGRVVEATPAAEQTPEAVASHFVLSGNREKAVEYLEKAAVRASSLSSLGEALELFDSARELGGSLPDNGISWRLARSAAELTTELGRYKEATRRWKEVLASATSGSQRAVALLELARTDHELHTGIVAKKACLEALGQGPDCETAAALTLLLAKIALREDDLAEVERLLDGVDRDFGSMSPRLEVDRASLWAGYLVKRGDLEGAADWATRAVKHAEECSEFGVTLRAKRDLGLIEAILGRLHDSRRLLERVFEDAMAAGYTIRAQEAVGNLLYAYLLLGNLHRGAILGRDALEWVSTPRWRTLLLDNLARIELERGLPERAEEYLLECSEVGEGEAEARLTEALALTRMASLDLYRGDIGSSEERARRALEISGTLQGRLDVMVEAQIQLAEIALKRGAGVEALDHAVLAVEATRKSDKCEVPRAWRVLSMSEVALGRESARETLTKALEMSQAMGMRLEEARALVALGKLDGDPQSPHFHRARELFAACGSERGLAELREAVASVRSA